MKKILIAGVVLIVAVAGIAFYTLSNLGPIVKKTVNTLGPKITKTTVNVNDVSISIFSGQVKIKKFFLGNPKGFHSAQAMKVASIYVDIDEDSITQNPVIINTIKIVSPEITYEKIAGSDNFQTILKNIKRSAKSEDRSVKTKGAAKDKKTKKIIINNVIIKSGKVSLNMTSLKEQRIVAPLPDIHLTDIGKKTNGTTIAHAFEQIFASLYTNISADSVTKIFNDSLKQLGKIKTPEDLKKIGSADSKTTKKIINSATKDVGPATKELQNLFN